MDNALEAYIKAENEANRVRMEREEGLFIGMMVSDPEFWADYGVYNVKQYQHYCAVEDYISYHKAVYGIKPRWVNFDAMSVEDIEEARQFLHLEALRQEGEAREAEEAEIASAMAVGAPDRETAERWLADAEW